MMASLEADSLSRWQPPLVRSGECADLFTLIKADFGIVAYFPPFGRRFLRGVVMSGDRKSVV